MPQPPTKEEIKFVITLAGAAWFWCATLYGRCVNGDADIIRNSQAADAVCKNLETRVKP